MTPIRKREERITSENISQVKIPLGNEEGWLGNGAFHTAGFNVFEWAPASK